MVRTVLQQGAAYGRGDAGAGQQVIIEFVSANPTGPLHVGHGRQARAGRRDVGAVRVAGPRGHPRVLLQRRRRADRRRWPTRCRRAPRGFKPGDAELAGVGLQRRLHRRHRRRLPGRKTVAASDGEPATASGNVDDIESIRRFAVTYLRNEQDLDLQAFGVKFDNYYLESSLYTDGKVERAVRGAGRRRQDLRSRTARCGCAPPTTATTRTA